MKTIEAKGLSKSYGSVRALRDVSFSVERGEVIGLLGPNGAGKTTLMKILTGFLEADTGTAEVAGIDVADDPLGVQSKLGYLPENAPLYEDMTVQEYLLMMATLRSVPEGKRLSLLADAVDATGLGDYLARPIGQLSKGYHQRVGLAQALLHRPPILILDEPTNGLDPSSIVEIRKLLSELSRDTTIVLSTHILSEVEMSCERVLMVMQGELRTDAKISELCAVTGAIVSIESGASGVDRVLGQIAGVSAVEPREAVGEYQRWRVRGERHRDICPQVYSAVNQKGWRFAELRPDAMTLETVFRELAETTTEASA